MRTSCPLWLSVVVAISLHAQAARAQERCDDAGLSELAAQHALEGDPPTELLARARRAGASHASLHVLRLAPDDERGRARWFEALVARGLGPLACGEAFTEAERVLVAAPLQGALRLEGRRVHVTLAPMFARPILYVRSRDREPQAFAVRDGVADLDLDALETPAQLQLVATGPEGPRPIAELSVGDGSAEQGLPADESVISWLRARGEAGPLRPNRLLARAAMEHAARVCASGHVAHEIADEGDAQARLARAHIEARHVGEVVARAQDAPSAWRALTASPSHRAALGDRRFTDVGVASLERGGRTCLVVLLASWPRASAR